MRCDCCERRVGAGLAEIVESLCGRVAELERRLDWWQETDKAMQYQVAELFDRIRRLERK